MNIIDTIEKEGQKATVDNFNVGDTVKVFVKIVEGTTERIQVFEGVVIAKKHSSVRETFTVRRVSYGVGVERKFLLHSPLIEKIEIVKQGVVRRGKLYYLRDLEGKSARIKGKINSKESE